MKKVTRRTIWGKVSKNHPLGRCANVDPTSIDWWKAHFSSILMYILCPSAFFYTASGGLPLPRLNCLVVASICSPLFYPRIILCVPCEVEPPHAADPDDADNPALREIKSSSAGPTVWSEFSALAAETGAINLGQVNTEKGVRDFDGQHEMGTW